MPYSKAQVAAMRSTCERKAAEQREQRSRDQVGDSANTALSCAALSFFAPEPPLLGFSRKRKHDDVDDEDEKQQDAAISESPGGERPTKLLRAEGSDHSVPSAFGYTLEALIQKVADPPKETHRQRRSSSVQRILADLNLMGPSNANHENVFLLAELPNELMGEVFTHLDAVDKACFALTSKQNYALVRAATHMIPRQLCPHRYGNFGYYYPCELSIKRKGDYRALLRQLVLFIPKQDMLYCLTRGGRQGKWMRELQTRHRRPWKKQFFKDLQQARMDVVVRLRRLEKLSGEKIRGKEVVKGTTEIKGRVKGAVGGAREEKEWEAVVKKGRELTSGGRVLRPRVKC